MTVQHGGEQRGEQQEEHQEEQQGVEEDHLLQVRVPSEQHLLQVRGEQHLRQVRVPKEGLQPNCFDDLFSMEVKPCFKAYHKNETVDIACVDPRQATPTDSVTFSSAPRRSSPEQPAAGTF